MKIAMVSPEMVPFAKTGGLADVAGALPKYLAAQGVECLCFLPYYKRVREGEFDVKDTGIEVEIPLGERRAKGRIFETVLPGAEARVYLVANDEFFYRDELYGTPEGDYPDNASRFIFFARAVAETLAVLGEDVSVVHCHDWQTALLPVYLKTLYRDKVPGSPGTLLTIHNLAYQGSFWHWDMKLTGLSWELFNWRQLEFYGKLNFLKGGIVFADALNTVSPTYAREIQTPELGCGLEEVLRFRSDRLFGIINGIDYDVWNPKTDPLIPYHYDARSTSGKKKDKLALQKEAGLDPDPKKPLIGMISRLAAQKGLDIIAGMLDELAREDVQLVFLGTGDKHYQDLLAEFGAKHPGKVSANIRFDNRFAHLIEAGSDMFLMPSRYEPCGLNQLYSLKYGTVPIVRRTGGLADTITDATPETIADGTATGVVFEPYTSEALLGAVRRALKLYADGKTWRRIMRAGMKQDWSWARSAREYADLYRRVKAWSDGQAT